MFNGKMKAITLSYDDGVTQDIRFIELLNKYNIKCTFNINSELLGKPGELIMNGTHVNHTKVNPEDLKSIYDGHEIAVHTLTHPNLTEIEDDAEIIRQVEQDRINLSKLAGYEVIGMAYPCGGTNNNDRVAEIIKNNTGVKYSRTITSVHNFDLQDNLYRFNPSVHMPMKFDKVFELAESFVNLKTDKPQIFYIWGHSYEFDFTQTWDKLEELLKLVSGKEDMFYGTNSEVLLCK